MKYSAGLRYSSPSIRNDSKQEDIGSKVGYHSCMPYAITAPDYQHPAALSPSTNDENGGRRGKKGEWERRKRRRLKEVIENLRQR